MKETRRCDYLGKFRIGGFFAQQYICKCMKSRIGNVGIMKLVLALLRQEHSTFEGYATSVIANCVRCKSIQDMLMDEKRSLLNYIARGLYSSDFDQVLIEFLKTPKIS